MERTDCGAPAEVGACMGMTLTSRKDRAAALAERIGHLIQVRNEIDDKLYVMRAELAETISNHD